MSTFIQQKALNWLKVTVQIFIKLQMFSISNNCCPFEQRILIKCMTVSTKILILLITINNKNLFYLPCDTEDWNSLMAGEKL